MTSTRLLVAGSLVGRQGATIKAIHEGSGAIVRVLGPGAKQIPFFNFLSCKWSCEWIYYKVDIYFHVLDI